MNKQGSILIIFYFGITLFLFSSCNSQSGRYNKDQHLEKNNFTEISNKGKINSGNSISICSWNLCDFGKTKSDSEIEYISNKVNDFDILLIQEVVAGDGGADAVIRLFSNLNTKGAKWDYTLSNPTTTRSDSKNKCERYAFLWKTNIVKQIGNSWLEEKYNTEIEREPFFCTFKFNKNDNEFTLVNFHAVTKTEQPEREIKYFKYMPTEYSDLHLLFCGDFNCNEKNTVFIPLGKMGYVPVFHEQKTSLKMDCLDNDCLSSEYDNAYYESNYFEVTNDQIIPFYKDFKSNAEARKISDHVPICFQVSFK